MQEGDTLQSLGGRYRDLGPRDLSLTVVWGTHGVKGEGCSDTRLQGL